MPTGKVASLSQGEVSQQLESFPNWSLKNKVLVRTEKFTNYLNALEFINKLGHVAEKEDHHPDIIMNYKTVTIKFSTHSAKGIAGLDFKMVKVADKIMEKLI